MEIQNALKIEEAAKILGVNKRTLDNWRSLGRGPAYIKPSKRLIRYLVSDVLAFRDSKKIEPAND